MVFFCWFFSVWFFCLVLLVFLLLLHVWILWLHFGGVWGLEDGSTGAWKIGNALTGAEKEFDGCGQFGLVLGLEEGVLGILRLQRHGIGAYTDSEKSFVGWRVGSTFDLVCHKENTLASRFLNMLK